MLNFNAKDQVFTNTKYEEREHSMFGGYHTVTKFNIENELSTEQKTEILNQFTDFRFDYFMALNNLFIKERDDHTILRDKYGNIRESTRFAWIRNHDSKNVFWDGKHKDNYRTKDYWKEDFFSYGGNLYFGYLITDSTIDNVFHSLIYALYQEEVKWFKAHDEYEILKHKFREAGCPSFGAHIATCSDGHIYVVSDENSDDERDITIDELKVLLEKNDLLLEYKQKLANEVRITF